MFALALLLHLAVSGYALPNPTPTFANNTLTPRAGSGAVLFEIDDADGTVYYDVTETSSNDVCATSGAMEQKGWSANANLGVPECSYYSGDTMSDIGTSRIVALNYNLLGGYEANKELLPYWCGKEVLIFDSAGNQKVLDEGPFYLWDGCEAASEAPIVDMSALGLIAVAGSCDANASGLKVQVVDNQIINPESAQPLTPQSTSFAYGAVQSPGAASSSQSAPASAGPTVVTSGGTCTGGSYQCAGNVLQQCNNVGTAWVVLDTCNTCTMNGAVPSCT